MNVFQHTMILLIRLYRWTLSPLLVAMFSPAGLCRYTPSCSAYAMDSVRIHGVMRGSWLAVRRLLRCHPWGGHGFDPVPSSVCNERAHVCSHSPSQHSVATGS